MFSCIFHGSSQCRLILMASSFVSLFMLSGLSPVRDVKSAQEKGRMQYASDQKVACFGKKLGSFKCFKKEDDQRNDTSGGASIDPIKPDFPIPVSSHESTPWSTPESTPRLTPASTPTSTPESKRMLTPLSKLSLTPESTPIMEHKDIQKNATDGATK